MILKTLWLKTINYGFQCEIKSGDEKSLVNFYNESKKKTISFQSESSKEFINILEKNKEIIKMELLNIGPHKKSAKFEIIQEDSKSIYKKNSDVELFSDGGARPNPGQGAFGVIIRYPNGKTEAHSKYFNHTTNNRMELLGVIEGVKYLGSQDQTIKITSDSLYVKNGITKWINSWKKNGWKTSAKKDVLNRDLWVELDKIVSGKNIIWNWVKGHSGHSENELCDELATDAINKKKGNQWFPFNLNNL